MKYLILLLALFMVSNVKAGLYLFDNTYFSDDMLKEAVTMCSKYSFPPEINLENKARICMVAAETQMAELNKEIKLGNKGNKNRAIALSVLYLDYIVKSCNYGNYDENQAHCDRIQRIYNDKCTPKITTEIGCEILEKYKNLKK